MSLTPSHLKRPIVNVGDNLATQKLLTGEHAQSVAIIGENGEHLGGITSPVVVTVENQKSVSGRVESDRDLFGRSRSSSPITLFESVLEYDLRPQIWGSGPIQDTGTVTHLINESSAALTVLPGQHVARISHEHFKYQAGKANIAYLTSKIGSSVGTVRRIGYFDEKNGVFLMNDGVQNSIVIRSSTSGVVTDTVVNQSMWSKDKLDGTGISGLTLDISKIQIFVVEVQGLGSGEIRVGFNIDSVITYVHEFHSLNILTGALMQTSSLPVCYQIVSTTGSGTLEQYDTSVISEGGRSISEEAGMIFSANNGFVGAQASNILSPIISIRPSMLFKGQRFNGVILSNDISILSDTTNIYWEVVLNSTLTGAAWSIVNADSATEYDISATSSSMGTVILSGYAERKAGSGFSIPLQKLAMTVKSNNISSDTLTLNVIDIQNKGGNIYAAINFSENY